MTGSNLFCRSVGSAVGVALFGAIANSTLGSGSRHSRGALTHHVFFGVLLLSVLMVAAVLGMPTQSPRAVDDSERPAAVRDDDAQAA